jgi:putative FmdB family regulatory protein
MLAEFRRRITMPIYEFRCPNGRITERFASIDTKEIECPECHQKAEKILSLCSFELKGGGWFADGYSSKKDSPPK